MDKAKIAKGAAAAIALKKLVKVAVALAVLAAVAKILSGRDS